MDRLHERLEKLEQQIHTLHQQTHTVTRQLRWWRGLACGLVVVSLLGLMFPSGTPMPSQGLRPTGLRTCRPSSRLLRAYSGI